MNYCILNGKKSTLIKGLLIQSLPPISKPLMRTTKETIDGRDGDIMRNVGYSAYDKTMSIGLFGDFDIDEVIKFFDSEGKVVFSNEPDKFYYYKIVNQIDFEKLIRFRTATVTFHCQPFKYSAVDDAFTFLINKLRFIYYKEVKSGITIESKNENITIKGTATSDIGFYLPINSMKLNGEYTLETETEGAGTCDIRIIESIPVDADSFGEQALAIDEGTDTLTDTVDKTFNFFYVSVTNGTSMNLSINAKMIDDDVDSFKVFNRGNTFSRPRLTIYGSGTVKLSINGVELFTLTVDEYITLDGAEMNAYKGETLKNRSVSGDYNNLKLEQGTNIISWNGDVISIKVENESRWI